MNDFTDLLSPARRIAFAAAAAVAGLSLMGTSIGCDDDDAELEIDTTARIIPVLQSAEPVSIDGDIAIEKSSPGEIRLGESTSYTINFANNSGAPLNGLIITEELPEGFQFESAQPEPTSVKGQVLTFRMNNMREGDGGQITINGTPQTVGDLAACTSYEFDRGICTMLTVVNPQLRLTKALAGEGPFSVCTPIELVYTVANEGEDAIDDVLLYDKLPEGMMLAEGGDTLDMELGDLQPGKSIEKRVMVKASRPDTFGSYAIARSDLAEVKSTIVDAEFSEPTLQIQATAERPFTYVGEDARFRINLTNSGEVAANQVVLATAAGQGGEILAVYGSEKDADGNARVDGQDRIFIGTLNPGQSRTLFVDVDLPDEAANIELGAVAQAVCADSGTELARAEGLASIDVRTISALQLEVVDKNDPVKVGDQTVYEVTVINEGSGDDNNLEVMAELPKGTKFVSGEGSTEITNEGMTVTFAPVDTLAAGDSVTWYVTVEVTEAAGGQKFNVKMNSDATDGQITEAEPTRLF